MSIGEVRKVLPEDIHLVQILIERCLQLYMNQKEVVEALLVQAKIEPVFTELVWQKLEEENREFFKAYHARLSVKHQISIFNELLEKQVELMNKICAVGVGFFPTFNGSNSSSLNRNSCFADVQRVQPSRPENMHHPVDRLSTTIRSGQSAVFGNVQSAHHLPACTGRTAVSPNMISTHNAHMGMIQGVNGIIFNTESGDTFGLQESDLYTRPIVGDASFSVAPSNPQALNTSHLNTDVSSFAFLRQIPRDFSPSDFYQSSADTDDFLNSSWKEMST